MKKSICLLVCLLCWGASAFGVSRIFVDTQGRSIEAELLKFEESTNTATIRRTGAKRPAKVPIDIFSADDQKFIREWGKLQALHDKSLKVVISRVSEKDKDNTYGTSASTSLVTDEGFNLRFENRLKNKLENIDLEYVIYYEQEHHVGAGGAKAKLKQGTLYVKDKITILPRQDIKVTTKTVKLRTWKTYSLAPISSDVHGIRVRLTLTSSSGRKETREFSYPSKLKQAWVSESSNAQKRFSN